jgi:hypothetical protein
LTVINVSVVFAACILRALALLMDSKIRFQCFCEIFLTTTIRSYPGRFDSSPFPPEEERNSQFLKSFIYRAHADVQNTLKYAYNIVRIL